MREMPHPELVSSSRYSLHCCIFSGSRAVITWHSVQNVLKKKKKKGHKHNKLSELCAASSPMRLLVVKKRRSGKYLRKWQMVNGPALDVEFHSLMCLSQA